MEARKREEKKLHEEEEERRADIIRRLVDYSQTGWVVGVDVADCKPRKIDRVRDR